MKMNADVEDMETHRGGTSIWFNMIFSFLFVLVRRLRLVRLTLNYERNRVDEGVTFQSPVNSRPSVPSPMPILIEITS